MSKKFNFALDILCKIEPIEDTDFKVLKFCENKSDYINIFSDIWEQLHLENYYGEIIPSFIFDMAIYDGINTTTYVLDKSISRIIYYLYNEITLIHSRYWEHINELIYSFHIKEMQIIDNFILTRINAKIKNKTNNDEFFDYVRRLYILRKLLYSHSIKKK